MVFISHIFFYYSLVLCAVHEIFMGMQALFYSEADHFRWFRQRNTETMAGTTGSPMFGKCWMIKGLYDYEQFKNVQKDIKGRQKDKN